MTAGCLTEVEEHLFCLAAVPVRILTRNPDHPKVKAEFNHPNVELVQGSFTDLAKVERALKDVWGAYINTDGFTVREQAETY